jgi:FG-GAP repeat
MVRRVVGWFFIGLSLLLLVAACSNTSYLGDDGFALFTDQAMDEALPNVATVLEEPFWKEAGEAGATKLPLIEVASPLTSSAVLPGAAGYIYYSQHDPLATNPWSVWRFDQSSDSKVRVYLGKREIQAVGGSLDGTIVALSMRQSAGADFEIYRLNVTTSLVELLTNNATDDIHVSLGADGLALAWQGSKAGLATVFFRNYDNLTSPASFTESVLNYNLPQREPTLSSNGRYLALARDIDASRDRVLRYDLNTNTYLSLLTVTDVLSSPSVSDNGNRVMWLQNTGSKYLLRVQDLAANTLQTLFSSPQPLEHPALTGDGGFATYGVLQSSAINLFTRNLLTGSSVKGVSVVSPRNLYGMSWQKPNPTEVKLFPADRAFEQEFGRSVAISGTTIAVGAPRDDTRATDAGAAYILSKGSCNCWQIVKKLYASDAALNDRFGLVVAVSGDTAVVGTRFENGAGTARGAVYVFGRNEGGPNTWSEVRKLTPSDAADSDNFGRSVSLSGDTLVVGADAEDGGGVDRGAAYIFERNQGGASNWGEVKKLTASNAQDADQFAFSISLDGTTLVVGSRYANAGGAKRGSAYIFGRDAGGANQWGEIKILSASDGENFDNFGYAAAVSKDTIVVGARTEDGAVANSSRGAAYVYERNQGGSNTWNEVKKLTASDAEDGANFGASVAVDGDTIVIGAEEKDERATDSGGAYLYRRNQGGSENWGEVKKLFASDGTVNDEYGHVSALEGNTVVIGAHGEDATPPGGGAIYIYE